MNRMTFDEIRLKKERIKNRILRKEYEIRDLNRSMSANLTLPRIRNQAIDFIIQRPDLMIKAGFIVFSIVQQIRKRRNR